MRENCNIVVLVNILSSLPTLQFLGLQGTLLCVLILSMVLAIVDGVSNS